MIVEGGELVAIREDKDASAAERKITFCNGGVMALAGKSALAILDKIDDRNAKKEFYLTDAVGIARPMGLKTVALGNRGGRRARSEHARPAGAKPKPSCRIGCAPRRSRPASSWWRRRRCILPPTRNSAATS